MAVFKHRTLKWVLFGHCNTIKSQLRKHRVKLIDVSQAKR